MFVAVGAALGAPTRWWVDRWVQLRWAPALPWGTFTVNVVGSLILGSLAFAAANDGALFLLVGIGFCGSLTTFSSFAWETFRLVDDGAAMYALVNIFGSLAACLFAAWCGWMLASALG